VEGLRFSVGKIDLNIAATPQDVGIAFHVQNEREFEAICFHIGNEARDESESQRVVVRYVSTDPDRNANHEAQLDLPYSQSDECLQLRTSSTKEVIAVFISADKVPSRRVEAPGGAEVYGSVGL